MPDAKQFFSTNPQYIIALLGEPGSGKTRAALTFPDTFVICADPAGIEVLKDPRNDALQKNLVWYEYFASESKKDLRDLFKQTDDPKDNVSVYGMLAHAKEMVKAGTVKTICFDGFSYFSDLLGAKIKVDIPGISENDRWAYYRNLKQELTWFTKTNLMSLARYGVNIILTLHIQKTSEEEQQKQATRDTDIAPRIEGGFRQALAGLPRAMIYLDHRIKQEGQNQSVTYKAYCQKVRVGNMGVIPAKNTYGLPAVLDLTDKSLYEVLQANMKRKPEQQPKPQPATTKTEGAKA